MHEYFRERTESIRAELVQREPFRQKFYAVNCAYDSQRGAVELSESEEIVEVRCSNDGEAHVITSSGIGNHQRRVRYHLQPVGDRWLIRAGEIECGICHGTGKAKNGTTDCMVCKGKGWFGAKDAA